MTDTKHLRELEKAATPERVCRPNPDTKFTRHWNIRAGKRGMKASVAFQKIGKK